MLERKYWTNSLAIGLLACTGGPYLSAATAVAPLKTQTMELGEWCTVTCPEEFVVGTVAKIKVAYRGIREETKLLCDLHYAKADGSGGGFLANDWRGKPTIRGDGEHTFTIPIRAKEGLASVTILVFTSPDGTRQGHTRLVSSKPIPTLDPYPGYARAKWNKSWIGIDYGTLMGRLVEGDTVDITVEYDLDRTEHFGTTTLLFEALGPRVPRPGSKKPQHIYYGNKKAAVTPGRGKHVFPFRIPKASPRNRLLFLARFVDGRGKRWPWDTRAGAWFVREGGFFELDSEKPGNVFTYDEPVRMLARLRNVKGIGQERILKYEAHDATRTVVAKGSVKFTVERDGQSVPVNLDLKRRGIFSFRAEVDGWESRETTFARIPDLMAITEGRPTRFGMTTHVAPWLGIRTDEVFQVARRLGLTTCRAFTEWQFFEPGPNVYKLEHWDRFFDAAKEHNVEVVITVYRPPAWVLPEGKPIGYRMFDCDWDAWREMVKTVTTRYKGKFVAWEWLNEITPGGSANYVDDYAKLCRIGTETARAIDPSLYYILAGGLWPRGFRLDVLAAGAGRYVDVLPVHYSNGSMIQEAREDLDSFGHNKVTVWDNETGIAVNAWGVPVVDQIADTVQPKRLCH